MLDLASYQLMVNQKAEEKSSDVLANAGELHAAIVMAKLFEKTTMTANMIVGSFDGKVSDQSNYMTELEKCIDRSIPFKIIFLNAPNENSLALQLLRKKQSQGRNIILKSASEAVRNKLKKTDSPIHYSVFDDDMYRYEKNTSRYLALFSFNDKKNANILLTIFNDSFLKSEII